MSRFNKHRPLSWSQISCFEWNPEEWYRKYVLNEREEDTKEMVFGKELAKSIEDGKPLVPVTTYSRVEHPFRVKFGDIELVGFADSFCDQTFRKLREYKTGKKEWTQKRADEHGQIDMYLLMNYITNKIPPEEVECHIDWIPTQENGDFTISFIEPIKIHSFKTSRTMQQILAFGARIRRVHKEMENYANNHA